jgi:cytochrome c-type biogenesis protein CcmH/NrfG
MLRRKASLAGWLLLAVALAACRRDPAAPSTPAAEAVPGLSDRFLSLMNAGKNHLDQGEATNALALYTQAAALAPSNVDVHLNLANSHLLAGASPEAIRAAEEVLRLEPNSAAAYFVKGSAYLRLANPEEAVKAFENVQKLDTGDAATCFQLGRARMELKQWDAAVAAFREGLAMDPNRLHAAAHYLLAQALVRAGRQDEADEQFRQHQASIEPGGRPSTTATFEKSKHTRPRIPFRLDQPDAEGVKVTFVDATQATLGESAARVSGPVAVMDVAQTGWNSLFVFERGPGFRLLANRNGTFRPEGPAFPAHADGAYATMLVGDLQNDRFPDVVVLGENGSHVFAFGTNGLAADVSVQSGLSTLRARHGTLMDLDFTGKLDLLAVAAPTNDVRLFRQFGSLSFRDITRTSGIPASVQNGHLVSVEDWNRDENLDVIVSRQGQPPLLLEKQRGGLLLPREPTNWVAGPVYCTGDFDNDLRPDLAVVGEGTISICWNGGGRTEIPCPGAAGIRQLTAVDYDNDGWLDLWAAGTRLEAWRNRGLLGFVEQTAALGLDAFTAGPVAELHFADFDRDCDSDVLVVLAGGGIRHLRNEGGNANSQVKVQLVGNRSNASGLGCKVEIETGGLRVFRTVQRLPVEIGVGKHQQLDSFLVHWFNWPQGSAALPFDCREPVLAMEMVIQEGSCPYLYAWDGSRFRFITDILGAAPLGLPVGAGRYTEADPEEYVWIGDERTFPPVEGEYRLEITEELREVLYLDEAKLVVVDHEPGTEVHATDKLLPAGPFPPGTLMTLHQEIPLQRAEGLDGQDVTAALRAVDGRRASPPVLRVPQLRGLAEPHGWRLDFGPLDIRKPLVLVMNGWIRFGGGMVNVAASQDPSLPFPFPSLDVEVAPGTWCAVDVTVGAPAGKTKTILVDLEGKLPSGARRLRLSGAFEIHWDRIALLEKQANPATRVTFLPPTRAELYFRGFSALEDLPPDWPLTPDYDQVSVDPYWTLIPGGWCTCYGDVSELVAARDEGLALINAGDALRLGFATNALPAKPAGLVRDFFLYVDGWDKDSDFHVAAGTRVEPLPFHGMQDQLYGREERPAFPSDELHRRYHTRWVEGRVLRQTARR